jgi:hypothetical protein
MQSQLFSCGLDRAGIASQPTALSFGVHYMTVRGAVRAFERKKKGKCRNVELTPLCFTLCVCECKTRPYLMTRPLSGKQFAEGWPDCVCPDASSLHIDRLRL